MRETTALEVHDLTKTYGTGNGAVRAIADVTLVLGTGTAERYVSMLEAQSPTFPRAVLELVDVRHVASRTALVLGWLYAVDEVDAQDPGTTIQDLPRLVRVQTLRGDFDTALATATRMWDQWVESDSPPWAWMSTAAATAVLACGMSEDPRETEWRHRMLVLADAQVADDAPVLAAVAAYVDARLALHRTDFSDAHRLVARCSRSFEDRWYEGFARSAGAELAVAAGLPQAADLMQSLTPYAAESDWVAAVLQRCRARSLPDPSARLVAIAMWRALGAQAELEATEQLTVRVARGTASITGSDHDA